MWALDRDCEEFIKSAWNEVNDAPNVAAVKKNLAACAKAFP